MPAPTSTRRRAAALALSLAVLALPAAASAAQVWTATSTEKIRPSAGARSSSNASISAARNEFEAFQVVVTGPASGVSATATDLSGPGRLGGVRLYREALIDLQNASAPDGATGEWPDALVPDVDELVGEKRNAFPFDVPSGESRAIWVEVHVPGDAAPGAYSGSVKVTWSGGQATVPVSLTVWPFTLPSTASLKSAFGLYYGALPTAHGVSGDDFSTLRARYGQLALDHRITLSRIDDANTDLNHYATFYGPAFDGTAPTTLAGAKMTAAEYMGFGSLSVWESFFQPRGWADRLFQYTCDEPPMTCAWSDIPTRAQQAHAAGVRTLVTTSIQEADQNGVTSSIDIMVPVINSLDDKAPNTSIPPSAYARFLAGSKQREVWTYQSCMSHGCGGTSSYYTGWPSYMIDASATRNRAMEWLSFQYGVTGELYYETCMAYSHDPWNNQWDFSGNGDGTLFYPGTPAAIGGTTHIPVASIRLKMIREGLEDYEYLKLVSDLGDPAFAKQVAASLFPHAYQTDVSPDALYAARAKIAQRIVQLTGGAVTAPGGASVAGSGAGATSGISSGVAVAAAGGGCNAGGGAGLLALAGLMGAVRIRRRRR